MTESERAYYGQRAPQYGERHLGSGLHAAGVRPGECVDRGRNIFE
jgi:hypothetical protein